jgi:hypothetical protein
MVPDNEIYFSTFNTKICGTFVFQCMIYYYCKWIRRAIFIFTYARKNNVSPIFSEITLPTPARDTNFFIHRKRASGDCARVYFHNVPCLDHCK